MLPSDHALQCFLETEHENVRGDPGSQTNLPFPWLREPFSPRMPTSVHVILSSCDRPRQGLRAPQQVRTKQRLLSALISVRRSSRLRVKVSEVQFLPVRSIV